MSQNPLSDVLEAVLLAAGRPVSVEQMLELFEEQQRPTAEEVQRGARRAREPLRRAAPASCARSRAAGACRCGPQHADVVSRLWQERPSRYSRALLETLALIAYRQPITRGEIEDIRGVTVASTIMRTLHERKLGPRGRPPRGAGPPGAARHDARVPRLLRLEEPRRPADARRAARPRRHQRAARVSGRRAGAGRACRRRRGQRRAFDEDDVAADDEDEPPADEPEAPTLVAASRRRRTLTAVLDERLHKLLAQHGIGSRRQVEAWIREGRVLVNGAPGRDRPARAAGRPRRRGRTRRHQAAGRRTQATARHPLSQAERRNAARPRRRRSRGRRDAICRALRSGRWVPVNALGFGEDGLLVLTSDGTLAAAIARATAARSPVEYRVRVLRPRQDDAVARRCRPQIDVEGEPVAFTRRRAPRTAAGTNVWFKVAAERTAAARRDPRAVRRRRASRSAARCW
ncbi:MAG: SMC-Scp complex subunit ScpB [Chromatiales bacterium]|nr:SMC-Scp complex subunit ScpB [Chromatiales bacterium]